MFFLIDAQHVVRPIGGYEDETDIEVSTYEALVAFRMWGILGPGRSPRLTSQLTVAWSNQ